MSSDIAISIQNLHKTFRLPLEKHSGIKQYILNGVKPKKKRVRGYENQHVLKGVSFDIKKGEFFGIVGRNGSGKSTLLKLLAGIYEPDEGSVAVDGTLVPFIELGVGFNPELTGRENVFLNGALLGFSHDEMSEMYDEIVEFAEISHFMDQKLKNYSSGMQVRLAFSIAIRAKSDILVLDEVLAVGDEAFQRKCNDYFETIKKDKTKTIVLVTHSMDAVKKYCDRAVLVRDGKIVMDGIPEDVANEYTLENFSPRSEGDVRKPKQKGLVDELSVKLISKQIVSQNDKVIFDIRYKVNTIPDGGVRVVFSLVDQARSGSLIDSGSTLRKEKEGVFRYEFSPNNWNNGEFKVIAQIRNEKKEVLAYTNDHNSAIFAIRNNLPPSGALFTQLGSGDWHE